MRMQSGKAIENQGAFLYEERGDFTAASSRRRQQTPPTTPAPNPARFPARENGAGLMKFVRGPGPMRKAATSQAQANRYAGTEATRPRPYIVIETWGKKTR